MYELYPYFTNDGTVGLFSRQDDDIYHSTYGALTESWQKFILPSNLKKYLTEHESVKILDICYGIGYNTKTALNVFINNFINGEKNIKKVKSRKKVIKKELPTEYSIEAIDTDNISKIGGSQNQKKQLENEENILCKDILIDAVDLDKTLIYLSPFIANASLFNFLFKKNYEISVENEFKYKQIKNIKNFKKFLKKEFKLKKEVSIILLEKLFESNSEFFNDVILQTILRHKKYAPFLDKFMLDFAKFYQNQGYIYNKNKNKLPNLHNIYYRYISKSYKLAQNLLKNNKIELNFHKDDARSFIKSTNHTYNFIFLDAFTPAKCPALWTVQFFKELYSKLENDGMVLTYSNSAAVRNAFLQNGFAVGKIYDSELKKFVGTVAAKNKNLIVYELDELDIDLINSKAGICFKDEQLDLENNIIIENRKNEVKESDLISSSKVLKGYKNDNI